VYGKWRWVWGFGVSLAIYCTASVSGAHLNPAVTVAFALLRGFPWAWVVPYAIAQLLGAVLAGCVVAASFWPFLLRFEAERGLQRGAPGSEAVAMVFGEYFPNPALFGTGAAAQALVSPLAATLVEGFGTAVLAFVIFALTDPGNRAAPKANLAPFFIGFTVAVLISLFAPITQAGWNPARDLGPRLVAFALGWGEIAIPGPRWGFLAYIAGPLLGAPLGGWLYGALLGTRTTTGKLPGEHHDWIGNGKGKRTGGIQRQAAGTISLYRQLGAVTDGGGAVALGRRTVV